MSNIINLPAIRPSLLLDFANSKTVDPRITFTRASTATYFDAQGLMRTAASGVPRIDHDPATGACKGLLVEEQRTNLFTNSEDAGTAWSTKSGCTVAADAMKSPTGTLTMDTMVESNTLGGHYMERSITLAANAPVSFSCYVMANGRSTVWLTVYANGYSDLIQGSFNLSTGSVASVFNGGTGSGATASMQNLGAGLWRLTISGTPSTAAVTDCKPRVSLINGSTIYQGDGASGIHIWGGQFEPGAFPTSYIPTTTAAVTRAADVASMSGTNFSSWYRQDEGSFVVGGDSFGKNSSNTFFSADDASGVNRIQLRFNGVSAISSVVVKDNTVVGSNTSLVGSFNTSGLAAIAYKAADTAIVTNGQAPTALGNLIVPTVTQLSIGQSPPTLPLNGHIAKVAYYPKRLSNAEMQALTA